LTTIVDTSVWSLALRRPKQGQEQRPAAVVLRKLVSEGQKVAMPGIVMQELLSGVRSDTEFDRLRDVLSPFGVICASEEHHLEAARVFNRCRRQGVATTAPDALIAATAIVEGGKLLTCDRDFGHMAKAVDLRVKLLEP